MVAAVIIRDVSYRYRGGAMALRGASLSVEPSSIVALLGPNGSGKSTLLRLVARIGRPDAGSIDVLGERDDRRIRARLGVVFQTPALDRRMTVLENLRAHAALHGLPRAEAERRIAALFSLHGLADCADDRVETLSGGFVRRVDLIRSLLHEPDLLLLDEPTTGLDPPSRAAFLDAVFSERDRRGTTVLISTHLVEEADRCDRVVMLHRGAIVADGAPAALRAQLGPRRIVVQGTETPPSAGRGGGAASAAAPFMRGRDGWSAIIDDEASAAALIEALTRGHRSFAVAPPTLADLFARATGEALDAGGDGAAEPADSRTGPRGRQGGRRGR
ncbi:MAG TPA: ABC transporter ATP-binding protein [Phycisphaerales bacterium]|nr:ABC transporter ATP-binding protein [Phycisphaerales bacterium]HMP36205.1 ABC transporter ATP-binding protein [Phycisphaerales bacterium]